MSHGTHSDWLILGQLILLQCPQANHGPAKTKQKAVLVCYNKQLIISNLEHYHWTLFWSPQKNLESRPCCQYWPHYRLFITMIRSPIKTSISVNNWTLQYNQINAHALIGQSAMAYCDVKLMLNSKPIEYWRVGALKVATEEGSNLLSSKEVTMAAEPQPTSRHLSTQHWTGNTSLWNWYLPKKCGGEGGKSKQAS